MRENHKNYNSNDWSNLKNICFKDLYNKEKVTSVANQNYQNKENKKLKPLVTFGKENRNNSSFSQQGQNRFASSDKTINLLPSDENKRLKTLIKFNNNKDCDIKATNDLATVTDSNNFNLHIIQNSTGVEAGDMRLNIPVVYQNNSEIISQLGKINDEEKTAEPSNTITNPLIESKNQNTFMQYDYGKNNVTENIAKEEIAKTTKVKKPYDVFSEVIKSELFINVGERLYFFNGSKYRPLTEREGKSVLMKLCRKEIEENGYTALLRELYVFLIHEPQIQISEKNIRLNYNLVAFRNGILNLTTNNFICFSKKIFITNNLDLNYENVANINFMTPVFDEFLNKVTGRNVALISRIWQVIGYILTEDMNAKAFFVLSGVPNSGKSVLGNLIQSFFEPEDVSAITLNDFSGRFSLSSIVDKRLNISMDLPAAQIDGEAVAKIKMLTGGDACMAEEKYSMPYKFFNKAKFVFGTNHGISLKSKDDAFMERLVLIPFNYNIPKAEQDRNLFAKLYKERLFIALKALENYRRFVNNNYIFDGDEFCCSNSEIVKDEDDYITEFLNECCIIDSNLRTYTSELFNSYNDFCFINGYKNNLSTTKFSMLLKDNLKNKIQSSKWRCKDSLTGESKNANGYVGIGLK